MCGGARSKGVMGVVVPGLSPRVRGSHDRGVAIVRRNGSIPACAGEPTCFCTQARIGGVYPRVCGGAEFIASHICVARGLSPRVRGSHGGGAHRADDQGSIPACAGEPSATRTGDMMRWVYPRVCGGAQPTSSSPSSKRGLSPRVRGSRDLEVSAVGQQGSIPACAGEPSVGPGGTVCTWSIPACAGEP